MAQGIASGSPLALTRVAQCPHARTRMSPQFRRPVAPTFDSRTQSIMASKPLWVCSASTEDKTTTLYDEIGGSKAIRATVEKFYDRMFTDEDVGKWFKDINRKKQEGKMIGFLTCVLKGRVYDRTLTGAHAKLVQDGLGDADFDVTARNLSEALEEMGVPSSIKTSVLEAVESTRDAVLGKISDAPEA